jgi:hypothetical protein
LVLLTSSKFWARGPRGGYRDVAYVFILIGILGVLAESDGDDSVGIE